MGVWVFSTLRWESATPRWFGLSTYAAANLLALTAVRRYMGLTVVAYLFLTLALGWSVFWFLGFGRRLGRI
jgi:uncharacterized oligopeptide transporter (OPT) family protein